MLNRRTLRAKAMQAIFAFRQIKEANFQIGLQNLSERFSPDLNSMEFQDKELLNEQKQKSHLALKEVWSKGNPLSDDLEDDVFNAVSDELKSIENQVQKDKRILKESMLGDVDKLKCHYISILELLIEFTEVAKQDTRRNHGHFVNNLLMKSIVLNERVEKAILECGRKWEGNTELRSWFKKLVLDDEDYLIYIEQKSTDFEKDKQLLLHLVKKIIFNSDVIDDYLEDKDIHWSENKAIIKSLVLKSLKLSTEEEPFELQDVSYNFDEDKTFIADLFEKSLSLDEKYKGLIQKKALNWDIDRLATTDAVILEMAITEMLFFPSIPVKVTINEYIEVSKLYSTPKSKQFINGILDVISNELKASGDMKKSGRGLMDNK